MKAYSQKVRYIGSNPYIGNKRRGTVIYTDLVDALVKWEPVLTKKDLLLTSCLTPVSELEVLVPN